MRFVPVKSEEQQATLMLRKTRELAVFLMFGLPSETWLIVAIWLVIGLAIYFFYGRSHSHLERRQEAGEARL